MAEDGRLAARLRQLRTEQWPGIHLTEARLAQAFSAEKRLTGATVSTWEQNTSSPTADRLEAYARFFATDRSVADGLRLVPAAELDPYEEERRRRLEAELLDLLGAVPAPAPDPVRRSWQFASGPITIICPEIPEADRGLLAKSDDPNYTAALAYADLDALIELHGHIRAENPRHEVFHKAASKVLPDDLSGHLVALGGVGWNPVSRDLLAALTGVPVSQHEDDRLATGEVFAARVGGEVQYFFPEWAAPDGETRRPVLRQDVAFLARVPNPHNVAATLTFCNGVHSRGVLGAVRCLTDARLRGTNEQYLARRFSQGDRYALLLRTTVVQGNVMTPDLNNPETILYEWPPPE